MALLLTLLVVSLLVVATLHFQKRVWHSLAISSIFKENSRLDVVAGSGIGIGAALLAADRNSSDSFLDIWAAPLSLTEPFPRAELQLRLVDLNGRFPLQALVVPADGDASPAQRRLAAAFRAVLQRLLESGAFALEEEPGTIVDSLADWLDGDEQERRDGVESGYYASLPRPYRSRNGPAHSEAELLLVKGVTPALLYGDGERQGLLELVSIHDGERRINLNTAPPLLLQSLDGRIDAELARVMDFYRRQPENADQLARPGWYRQIPGWPADLALDERMLTVRSGRFRLASEALFAGQGRRQVVDMRRRDGKVVVQKRVE